MGSKKADRRRFLKQGAALAGLAAVFDVIYRAMPAYQGGTLSPDEVYALTAYLLYKNEIVKEDTVLNAATLPEIEMPNRHGFIPDKLEDIPDLKKRGCYKTYGTCP